MKESRRFANNIGAQRKQEEEQARQELLGKEREKAEREAEEKRILAMGELTLYELWSSFQFDAVLEEVCDMLNAVSSTSYKLRELKESWGWGPRGFEPDQKHLEKSICHRISEHDLFRNAIDFTICLYPDRIECLAGGGRILISLAEAQNREHFMDLINKQVLELLSEASGKKADEKVGFFSKLKKIFK